MAAMQKTENLDQETANLQMLTRNENDAIIAFRTAFFGMCVELVVSFGQYLTDCCYADKASQDFSRHGFPN